MGNNTTVAIWGLPTTATKEDVQRFIQEEVPECQPIISPLVLDKNTDTKGTTVTLKCCDEDDIDAILAHLKKKKNLGVSPPYSTDAASCDEALGNLTILASKSEDPAFE